MDVRKDFEEVKTYIASLLNFSKQFSSYDERWIHYKNREDFDHIFTFSARDKLEVERLYSTGRNMASYMAEMLARINHDFSKFPNLTSVVVFFDGNCVYRDYDANVSDRAVDICISYDVDLYSVTQMSMLFKEQENLLYEVRKSLDILKRTNLYKLENGGELMNNDRTIVNITGNSSSSINFNSDKSNASVSQYSVEMTIFEDIVEAINLSPLDEATRKELIESTSALEDSHKKGNITDGYKSFIQNISAHMTVFIPFIPRLTGLL